MDGQSIHAICVLNNPDKGIKGIINLEQPATGPTVITINFSGLKPGKHGFHIHEFGNLSNACVTAGAHYNPYKKTHGGPGMEERHVGDLGNVEADSNGNYTGVMKDDLIKLCGEYSVIGRSIIVHEDEDDLGTGTASDSKTTGHAGARLACGIIGVTNPPVSS
jgi:Cu-Zn family superoxide dismutase